MAKNGNRTEGADISAVSLADGGLEYLPEKSDPAGRKAADILRCYRKPKTAADVDFTDVLACHIVENMI